MFPVGKMYNKFNISSIFSPLICIKVKQRMCLQYIPDGDEWENGELVIRSSEIIDYGMSLDEVYGINIVCCNAAGRAVNLDCKLADSGR